MKKNIFHFALMAAMVCGLSLAATSCKDDDKSDNNNGENMEQLESTGGDLTMEEVQLSSLISNFSAVQADELLAQSGWQQKTYDVDFGMVLDESRPTVRTVEVGTLEEADEEACALLDQLGIDFQSPAGFQFSNASVGTVSYQHGGGSDANTLAVINLDVRLPTPATLRATTWATSSARRATSAYGSACASRAMWAAMPTSSASGPTTPRTTAAGAARTTTSTRPRSQWPAS